MGTKLNKELRALVGRNAQKGDGCIMDMGLAIARAAYRLGHARGVAAGAKAVHEAWDANAQRDRQGG